MTRPRRPSPTAAEAAPTALVVAADAPLTRGEQRLLAEAIRRGEEARGRVEDALVEYGRWLLVNVFDDDAGAALERTDNRVWRALLDRAGGPSLRADRRFVHVALAIAAHDKRIQDESWRLLDPGRKEVLLRLGDERAMREAAQHVVAMKLSNLKTRAYVRGVLAEQGKVAQVRVTLPRVSANARKLRERFGATAYRKAFERTLRDAENDERAAVRKELEALRTSIEGLLAIARR